MGDAVLGHDMNFINGLSYKNWVLVSKLITLKIGDIVSDPANNVIRGYH
jgi:hypothetical protein